MTSLLILTPGARIRTARLQKGLTQRELASPILSVGKLSAIENDKVLPDAAQRDYLSDRLTLSPKDLGITVAQELEEHLARASELSLEDLEALLDAATRHHLPIPRFAVLSLLCARWTDGMDPKALSASLAQLWSALRQTHEPLHTAWFLQHLTSFLCLVGEYEPSRLFFEIFLAQESLWGALSDEEAAQVHLNYLSCTIFSQNHGPAALSFLDPLGLNEPLRATRAGRAVDILSKLSRKELPLGAARESLLALTKEQPLASLKGIFLLAALAHRLGLEGESQRYFREALAQGRNVESTVYLALLDRILERTQEDLAPALIRPLLLEYDELSAQKQDPAHRQKAAHRLAGLAYREGDKTLARRRLEASLKHLEQLSDDVESAKRLLELGDLALETGCEKEALALYERARILRSGEASVSK
ncbi:hypothetical protein ABB02_01265 [Clostridiaceae bacterium JG1575]|nr:hypothetical protein ABB02_01265 [Clostridiaceae bacterium JG1575]